MYDTIIPPAPECDTLPCPAIPSDTGVAGITVTFSRDERWIHVIRLPRSPEHTQFLTMNEILSFSDDTLAHWLRMSEVCSNVAVFECTRVSK